MYESRVAKTRGLSTVALLSAIGLIALAITVRNRKVSDDLNQTQMLPGVIGRHSYGFGNACPTVRGRLGS